MKEPRFVAGRPAAMWVAVGAGAGIEAEDDAGAHPEEFGAAGAASEAGPGATAEPASMATRAAVVGTESGGTDSVQC